MLSTHVKMVSLRNFNFIITVLYKLRFIQPAALRTSVFYIKANEILFAAESD